MQQLLSFIFSFPRPPFFFRRGPDVNVQSCPSASPPPSDSECVEDDGDGGDSSENCFDVGHEAVGGGREVGRSLGVGSARQCQVRSDGREIYLVTAYKVYRLSQSTGEKNSTEI